MNANVKEIVWTDSREAKHGILHSFKMTIVCKEEQFGFVSGDEVRGFYSTNDQGVKEYEKRENGLPVDGEELISKKFRAGEDAAVTIEENVSTKTGKRWYKIRPEKVQRGAKYNQSLRREQSKYSGFSDSYVKDLLVAGILKPETTPELSNHNDYVMETWMKRAEEIFNHMVALDKTMEE